ncbi:MAG: hypothetical protein WBG73_23555 [Coleofasciculaceae cyanobacterium]
MKSKIIVTLMLGLMSALSACQPQTETAPVVTPVDTPTVSPVETPAGTVVTPAVTPAGTLSSPEVTPVDPTATPLDGATPTPTTSP